MNPWRWYFREKLIVVQLTKKVICILLNLQTPCLVCTNAPPSQTRTLCSHGLWHWRVLLKTDFLECASVFPQRDSVSGAGPVPTPLWGPAERAVLNRWTADVNYPYLRILGQNRLAYISVTNFFKTSFKFILLHTHRVGRVAQSV